MSDYLGFENSERDFPFYRHNPRISKTGWIVLLFSTIFSFILYGITANYSEFAGSIVFCLVMLVPLAYYSKWDLSSVFYKPTKKEVGLAFLMFAGYIVYAYAVSSLLDGAGLGGSGSEISQIVNLEMIVSLVFSMMGEELLKFIPLMFLMRLIYKYLNNRKISIILSSVIVMLGFGLLHYSPPETTLVSVLLLQGLGSVFEFYGYIKTKNIFVPYMSHLFTDAFLFTLMLLHIGV